MKKIILLSSLTAFLFMSQFGLKAQTPVITMIQPNEAGIEWVVGTSHLISWTDNFTFPVKIDLIDYTVPLTPVITNITLSAAGSTYSWAIPLATPTGTHYKVKVSSAACGDCYSDESDHEFALVSSTTGTYVHMEQPNVAGTSWCKGSTHLISWSGNAPGNKKLKLYKGGVFHSLIEDDIVGSTYNWTLPDDGSIASDVDYKVRVSCMTDDAIEDYSDNNFAITEAGAGTITVVQPSDAGIIWAKGDSYLISWTDNITANVDIELWKAGVFNSTIATDISGSSYVWTIPNGTATASTYKVKIKSHTDGSTLDFSDNFFTINPHGGGTTITVLQPNDAGITWLKGSTYTISWIDNVPGTVKISLYKAGVLHSVLALNVVGTTYLWTIPDDGSIVSASDYKIRVSSTADGTYEDFSNNDFSIGTNGSGTITVLQPNVSGITWVRGYSYLISWIDDVSGTMDIKLYKGGVLSSTIATEVVGSTYVWDIPIGTTLGADYTIKVFSHNDAGTFDESNNNFAIQVTPAGGTITVLQPNGGENWFQTLSYYISWDDNFPEPVDIDLVTGAGVFVSSIASDVVGSTYVWNTTGTPLGDYKVKITSTLDATLTDMSNAVFHLICLPLVNSVYPNPANQQITIKLDDATTGTYVLRITDRFNMEILNKKVQADGMKEIVVSTSEIPNGVYFLSISSDSSVETKKILIQH
jgi:hypothetical protein